MSRLEYSQIGDFRRGHAVKHYLSSLFSYRGVRRSSTVWAGRPSGLGHFDIALYILIGRELERQSGHGSDKRGYWILDLGTYFGHSAFAVAYGASTVSKDPALNVLSIDLFEQPKYLLASAPEVVQFVKEYGSTEPDAIGRWLDSICGRIGLKRNPIRLMKQDVFELPAQDLAAIAPEGYRLIAVDCAKTPEVMNRVSEFLTDPLVCRTGTKILFQDLFDWHAPWNAYALWRLLKAGALSLRGAGPQVTPLAEKVAQRQTGTICDNIQPSRISGETWSTPFTTLENEVAALEGLAGMFREWGYTEFFLRLDCLKVGALLRAGRLEQAETLITKLDQTWPAGVRDSYLQNAYCRMMHLKTGRKDLSLVFDTSGHRARNSFLARTLRGISGRLQYFKPIAVSTQDHPTEPPVQIKTTEKETKAQAG